MHESAAENFRIRKCVVLYYLEDDSMQVCSLPPATTPNRYERGRVPARNSAATALTLW